MEPLFHGIVLAFGLILPLGMQNVFIFNQGTAHKKFSNALPAIITAGVCDTILIYSAVAGVSVLVIDFGWLRNTLYLGGFFFLIYMGGLLWKSSKATHKQVMGSFTTKRQIIFAASVSLLNPHGFIDIVIVIGTSSLIYTGMEKWIFTFSCIGVSWVWFFALASVGRQIGQLDKTGTVITRLNQISAIIIWGIAIYMGWQLINLV
ncbi:LysE family transporter [Planococcus shenhongbingii]|uniref:LysE family transporter n=1 Tax=Planococcus shenhongbingii TaxID=3058398 RepID=A0ABT8NF49_9BACL|nr:MULTISPECIES: LysE family transporter [unclassified Planococcus (in: firmicutes)]MDN7246497.1 LysE family transporter [Planococcus sp. N017]WKA59486.1 LysE family transporter [Planococcus sp. N016]